MKKTLVAIAALTALGAQAQSAVTIDGIFDVGYQSINYKGTKISGVNGNGSSTSQLNFRVTQDLGAGLKAIARLESDFNSVAFKANTGVASVISNVVTTNSVQSVAGTFGNGEVWAGLQGDFGVVKLGSVNMNTLTTTGMMQPFGTAIGSGYNSTGGILRGDTTATTVRDENAIRWDSPAFNGFTGVIYYSAKQTNPFTSSGASTGTGYNSQQQAYNGFAYDKQGSNEYGLNYANGPLTASVSRQTQSLVGVGALSSGTATTGSTATTLTSMAAAYTMGNWKASLGQQKNITTQGTAAINTNYVVGGLTYTSGPINYMVSNGAVTQNLSSSSYLGKKSKLFSIGANYNLSKTTYLYVRNENINDDANILAAASTLDITTSGKRTRTAVGLSMGF